MVGAPPAGGSGGGGSSAADPQAPIKVSDVLSKRGAWCIGDSILKNLPSLALDAAGFIPGESQAVFGFQMFVGVASTVNSAIGKDTAGSMMAVAGFQLKSAEPAVSIFTKPGFLGLSAAEAVPLLGTLVNVAATGYDLYHAAGDVKSCYNAPD